MRRLLTWGVLLTGLVALCGVRPAQARELKIGVVNLQRAVEETDEGQRAEKDLQGVKTKLENELNRQLKEFYEEEEKLRKAWSILKDEEKRKRANESRTKFEGLQKRYMDAERELMNRKTEVMVRLTEKLTQVIEQIAKRDNFDYIFNNAAVLWAPRHVDVTNEVIRMYNETGRKGARGKAR